MCNLSTQDNFYPKSASVLMILPKIIWDIEQQDEANLHKFSTKSSFSITTCKQ